MVQEEEEIKKPESFGRNAGLGRKVVNLSEAVPTEEAFYSQFRYRLKEEIVQLRFRRFYPVVVDTDYQLSTAVVAAHDAAGSYFAEGFDEKGTFEECQLNGVVWFSLNLTE